MRKWVKYAIIGAGIGALITKLGGTDPYFSAFVIVLFGFAGALYGHELEKAIIEFKEYVEKEVED